MGCLAPVALAGTVAALDGLYDQLDLIDVDDRLVRRAGELAELHALRGDDAIHLAAAERVTDDTTILMTGDRDLCEAAGVLGLAVANTSVDG